MEDQVEDKDSFSVARYLLSRPIILVWSQRVSRIGMETQRFSIELAMRQPGTPLFNTSAPVHRQQAQLGIKH